MPIDLKTAYRAARRGVVLPYALQGYVAPTHNGKSYASEHDGRGAAAYALHKARAMVEAGRVEYPRDYDGQGEARGLRYVGRVIPDFGGGVWDSRDDCGWLTDPYGDVFKDGSGLCFGVVYQLPGKDGAARFVAGYQFGGVDGGPTLDFATIYTARTDWQADAKEAARETRVCEAADKAAKAAAETEREYQTAWQAGRQWADKLESEQGERAATLELLRQNRESGGSRDLPAIHATIRAAVCRAWESIQESRRERKALADGDSPDLIFYPDDDAKNAFCEAAGLEAMPA